MKANELRIGNLVEARNKNRIKKMRKKIPLETRIRVDIEAFFIPELGGSFLIRLNKNGTESKIDMKKNQKCWNKAKILTDILLTTIEEWENDNNKIRENK